MPAPRRSPAADRDLERLGEAPAGLGEAPFEEVGHAEPAHGVAALIREAGLGRGVEGLAQRLVAAALVAGGAVGAAGDEEGTDPHRRVVGGVGGDLLGAGERLGDPAELQQGPRVDQPVAGWHDAAAEHGGPLGGLRGLGGLAGRERLPGGPAQRLHAERRGGAGQGVGAQPDDVGQARGALGVLGDERVGRPGGYVEAGTVPATLPAPW